jgi:hypothetical protein
MLLESGRVTEDHGGLAHGSSLEALMFEIAIAKCANCGARMPVNSDEELRAFEDSHVGEHGDGDGDTVFDHTRR